MRSEKEYLSTCQPLNRRERISQKQERLQERLNKVKKLGDERGTSSQMPPFPRHELAGTECSRGLAGAGNAGERGGRGPTGRPETVERGQMGRQQQTKALQGLVPISSFFSALWSLPLSEEVLRQETPARLQPNSASARIPQCRGH